MFIERILVSPCWLLFELEIPSMAQKESDYTLEL